VTHDQEEALELAEHVVVMNQGRVEQAGAPAAIYDHPATPFVASFVGGASVLRGKVAGGRAEIGAGSVAAPEGAPDGAAVSAYVRPHDVRVAHAPAADEKATVGRVRRLTRVGGWVKVDVALPTGEEMTVQMSRIEVERLRVTEGDPVMVDLLVAKVFVDDYSI
jgi:sulfate transport system ATP-binding protein